MTVMPTAWCEGHELVESPGSKANEFYSTADGTTIYNKGEKKLTISTLDGSLRSMTFQCAGVNKALGSVSQIVKNGNTVVFSPTGSYIENLDTKEKLWLRERGGVYVLDVLVAPPETKGKETQKGGWDDRDFTRRGW